MAPPTWTWSVLMASKTRRATMPVNTQSIVERSQYRISNHANRSTQALLIQASKAGKEDIFKICGHRKKTGLRYFLGKDVNLGTSGDELVGDYMHAARVIFD